VKKSGPGCRCFYGLSWDEEGTIFPISDPLEWRVFRICGSAAGDANLDLSDVPAFGAGAHQVGADMERRRLLVQLLNGEVWTYSITGDAALLWQSTSDAAGVLLSNVKYHHSWGYAVLQTVSDIGQEDSPDDVYSVDADGNFVEGPFPDALTHGQCIDSSGDVYQLGDATFVDDGTDTTATFPILRNGVEFSTFTRTTDNIDFTGSGVIPLATSIFSDGTDVYMQGDEYTGGLTATLRPLFKLVSGGSSNGSAHLQSGNLVSEFGSGLKTISNVLYDDTTNTIDSRIAGSGFDSIFRWTLDLSEDYLILDRAVHAPLFINATDYNCVIRYL
jgi:hypothetical protein